MAGAFGQDSIAQHRDHCLELTCRMVKWRHGAGHRNGRRVSSWSMNASTSLVMSGRLHRSAAISTIFSAILPSPSAKLAMY